jgi:hypothetical protein
MNAIVGYCKNCDALVWGQVDGDPPICIYPTCVCFNNKLVVPLGFDYNIIRKLPSNLVLSIKEK